MLELFSRELVFLHAPQVCQLRCHENAPCASSSRDRLHLVSAQGRGEEKCKQLSGFRVFRTIRGMKWLYWQKRNRPWQRRSANWQEVSPWFIWFNSTCYICISEEFKCVSNDYQQLLTIERGHATWERTASEVKGRGVVHTWQTPKLKHNAEAKNRCTCGILPCIMCSLVMDPTPPTISESAFCNFRKLQFQQYYKFSRGILYLTVIWRLNVYKCVWLL
jgi:hypothetical protein